MKHYLSKLFIGIMTACSLLFFVDARADIVIVGDTTSNTTLNPNYITSGGSSTIGYMPFYYNYSSEWNETLFSKEELQAAGMESGEIKSLSLQLRTKGSRTYTWGNFSIRLANTDLDKLTSGKTTPENVDYIEVFKCPSTEVEVTPASASPYGTCQYRDGFGIDTSIQAGDWVTFEFKNGFATIKDGTAEIPAGGNAGDGRVLDVSGQPFQYTGGGLLVYICYWGRYYGGGNWLFTATKSGTVGGTQYGTFERTYGRFTDAVKYTNTDASLCGIDQTGISAANGTSGSTQITATYTAFRLVAMFDIEMGPKITGLYPKTGDVFGANVSTGDIIKPNMTFNRKVGHPKTQYSYKVVDPNGTVVYQAVDPSTRSEWIDLPANEYSTATTDITKYFKKAIGIFADSTNPDTARLAFRDPNIVSGDYKVYAAVRYFTTDGTEKIKPDSSTFTVNYKNDIALVDIDEPKQYKKGTENTPEEGVYALFNNPITMLIQVKNVGASDINSYKVHYLLESVDSITKVRKIIDEFSETIALPVPLQPGSQQQFETEKFIPANYPSLKPGYVNLKIRLELAGEDSIALLNNIDSVYFKLESPYDGKMVAILAPEDSNAFKNQPVFPEVIVRNEGTFKDPSLGATEIPIYVVIRNKSGLIVYDEQQNITNLTDEYEVGDNPDSAGHLFRFSKPWIPLATGEYEVTATISTAYGDPNINNNSLKATFNVQPSMKGTYSIGGSSSTYPTISAALNDVYRQGVDGDVTFELAASTINVGDVNNDQYALDFSSSIAGFNTNPNSVIRFVPSRELARVRGGVSLKLNSKSGIGIRFGSSTISNYPGAPVNRMPGENKKDYYPFNARVIIDGGANQSIRFEMGNVPTNQTNNILLYLAEGASNITIKNCLLVEKPSTNVDIPLVLWDRDRNEFTFDSIKNLSTCILLRGLPPGYDAASVGTDSINVGNKVFALDTLVNKNIVISDNYVEGGGYGIVSLGIGALYHVKSGTFKRYYNTNNQITNNLIVSQTRAGIYLGYEESSYIGKNRIYKTGAIDNTILPASKDVAGIMLGGEGTGAKFGYNNISVVLDGNEVSSILSAGDVYGIKIEQERNNYYDMHIEPHGLHSVMPNVPDGLQIYNNLVWDIASRSIDGSRYGIRMFTARDTAFKSDKFKYFINPKEFVYNILNSNIINNSVIFENDKVANSKLSFFGGIVMQNVDTLQVYNNAINFFDNPAIDITTVSAPIILESVRPDLCNILMNNNIYYNNNNDIVRFIELSSKNKNVILSTGYHGEFMDLDQWGYWSGADKQSYIYDYENDIYKIESKIPGTSIFIPKIRVKSPVPVGSYLNNRGKNITSVATDIDGNTRGATDQAYDIGAWEFDGQLYNRDLDILGFNTPVAYRDRNENSIFYDAEYFMTTNPVSVKVNIRNNGNSFIQSAPVKLTIYQIDEADAEIVVLSVTENISIASFETKVFDFKTDLSTLPDRQFKPVPYAQIIGMDMTTVPDMFKTMTNNVTQRYKFKVELPVDEDLSNNTNRYEKIVRFYVKNSNLHSLISVENSTLVPDSIADYYQYIIDNINVADIPTTNVASYNQVAGFGNYRAIRGALDSLGFHYGNDGYDILDRANWPIRSINYTFYQTMFWSDGLDSRLTEYQEDDINQFVNASTIDMKRYLIMSSEELERNSYANAVLDEEDYFRTLFNIIPRGNGERNPIFDAQGYDQITGVGLSKGLDLSFGNTPLVAVNKDKSLISGIFEPLGAYNGTVEIAYFYTKPFSANKNQKTMGTISYNLKNYGIYLGLDWRHYADPKAVVSSIFDFIQDKGGAPFVPVELLSFDAFVANNQVYLTWTTAHETSNEQFIVEKANANDAGMSVFAKINEVKANGIPSDYNMIDADVKAGAKYAYRLKYIDVNGDYSYSNERIVAINESGNFMELMPISPNPVNNNTLDINFILSADMNVRLSIYDVNGSEVAVILNTDLEGKSHQITSNVSNLASGSYSLVLSTKGNSISQSFKIVR